MSTRDRRAHCRSRSAVDARTRSLRRPAAAIIAALSVDSASGGMNTGMPDSLAARLGVGAQPAVGRHAAGDADAPRAEPPRRLERAIEQRLHDHALEARRNVGDLRRAAKRRRRPPAAPSSRADVPQHRGLQAAETEIDAALDRRRQQTGRAVGAGALRSACVMRGTGNVRAVVSLPRDPIDDRPAGIAEPEQLGHLVVRLARRVVPRAADQLVAPGCSERDTGSCGRRTRRAPPPAAAARRAASTSDSMWPARWCTGTSGMPRDQATRLRERHADQQRADEPRPLRHRDRPEVRSATPRLLERALDDAADVAQVLARRQLRHDAAPLPMDRGLRGDDVRAHRPGPLRRRRFPRSRPRPSRRRRFRSRGGARVFYATTPAQASRSVSLYGGRKMPRSVMMPVM